jgi:hypothetical protein
VSVQKLTYEEVCRFVGYFNDEALDELAKGPLPDDGDTKTDACRVCAVLVPFTSSGPASVLLEWHDFVSKGYRLLTDIISGDYEPGIEDALIEDVQTLVGDCSYARCSTIYGAATAELLRRRLAECEDPEPPEPDPDERRRDDEAEDAERRLDAEKVGDL